MALARAPFHPVFDPRFKRERFRSKPLGQPSYLAVKAKGEKSMAVTQALSEDVKDPGLQDPRDMVRTALFEL